MKRVLVPRIALCCLLSLLALPAAANAAGEVVFGFQGGVNFANMGGDMDDIGDQLAAELEAEFGGTWTAEKASKTGLAFGGYYSQMFSPTLGLQVGALYANRGVKFDMSADGIDIETKLKFDYLDVPILLRVVPSPEANVQPMLLVGPVVGFKLSSELEVSGGGVEASEDIDDVKSTVFSLMAAAGVRFGLGEKNALQLQARYQLGLSNAIDDPDFSSSANDLTLLAGLEIGLGQ
jgi:hypothetical protein